MNVSESGSAHKSRLNDAFSSLPRLKVAAFLAGCDEAEFAAVAMATDTPASALSKAAARLVEENYLSVRKGHVGRRPRTWLSLTEEGRQAFSEHMDSLKRLTALGVTHARESGS